MNIKEAQYVKELKSDEIGSIRITVGDIISQVPIDEANTDYVEIMRQVAEKKLTIKGAD
jgi:hypothetical protein